MIKQLSIIYFYAFLGLGKILQWINSLKNKIPGDKVPQHKANK